MDRQLCVSLLCAPRTIRGANATNPLSSLPLIIRTRLVTTQVVLDTKGTGKVDTVGVDTTGDGIADTFYNAKIIDTVGDGADDVVKVDTTDPRKASNMYGGQGGARESQKAHFEKKSEALAALCAKVDEGDDASRASDDFSFAD